MLAAILVVPSTASAQTTTGTWVAYPGQSTAYQTQVKQPINDVNSASDPNVSVFANKNKNVIPVKFALLSGLGPFVFESIWSDGVDPDENTTNDYSFLSFTPTVTPPLTFNDLDNLTAVYSFTLGDCHGGSLRWQVRVDSNRNGVLDRGTRRSSSITVCLLPSETAISTAASPIRPWVPRRAGSTCSTRRSRT